MYTIFTFHDYDLVMVVVGAAQKKFFTAYYLVISYQTTCLLQREHN